MKKVLLFALIGGTMALASCGSGPSAEEKAALEQAKMDSIKAVEQAALEAEAAAAAAAAKAEAAASEVVEEVEEVVEEVKEEVKTRPGAVSTSEEKKAGGDRPGAVTKSTKDASKARPGAVKKED